MEKENPRVNKADGSPIKNQNEYAERKEYCENKIQDDDKQSQTGTTKGKEMKCEEDGKEDEELLSARTNAMFGLCAICHLTLGNISSGLNQNMPCSKGHALCQRCIQHFTVQSDQGCVLCHPQYQQSSTHLSRESSVSLYSRHVCPKRMQNLRPQSEYYYSGQQRPQYISVNAEQSLPKSWNQYYSPLNSSIERNILGYHNDFIVFPDYEQNKDQSNFQEELKDKVWQKQQQSFCNLSKKGDINPYIYEAKVNGQVTVDCSRRPIRCPRIDCAINVAFSALTHHFIFDHPEVPILNVEPGIKSTLVVSFNAISSNTSRCLALLLVSGKLPDPVARLFNGGQINPRYRNRLPLPVLAARLQCTDEYVSKNKVDDKTKNLQERNVIIAWVAGLDIGNTTEKLLCSIQAVDKIDSEGLRSLTYTGPVNSLRTAQCPQDIFSTGDCIILHEGFLSHITSDCATLNVNVNIVSRGSYKHPNFWIPTNVSYYIKVY